MKILVAFIIVFVGLTISAQNPKKYGINSSDDVPEGLEEGVLAPDFEGKDQDGKMIRLKDQLKGGPVVLIFYRGYWCPVCNKYLSKFQEDINLIVEKGASVIAVSPEANDGATKTISKNDLTFSVLSDEGYRIMDKYGVRFLVTDQYAGKIKTFLGANIASNNDDELPYLPIPATYIIDQDGKIKKVFFDQDYKNRPTVSEIIKWL